MFRGKKQIMINACAAIGFALLVGAAPSVVEAMRPDWERSGRFLGLDKAGMEYFKLEIISTQSRRIGSVTLTSKRELETPYLGRRYTGGATSFSGEMTSGHAGELVGNYPPTTLRVFRQNGPHEGTLFIEVEKQGDEWIGNFFDVDGTTTGELVITQDYAATYGGLRITRVCRVGSPTESNYICIGSRESRSELARGQREPAVCHDQTFPGRYSHLSHESCEDELEDFYCNSEKKKPRYLYNISCEKPESDPSPSPAKHPTSCDKDPKKEPHFHDCNGNIYLPGHMPKECIPEEPAVVVQKPVEPPKVDPIIGVYVMYYTTIPEQSQILRVYPNNRAHDRNQRDTYRWEKDGKGYPFYYAWDGAHRERPNFILKAQSISGEPDVVSYGTDNPWRLFEGIKISDNPDHLFDHYQLSSSGNEILCSNVGRKEKHKVTMRTKWGKDFASTLEECEALCLTTAKAAHPQATCPQDRR